ncbi:hypothetical protein DFH27DRAFT_221415 [Peziza echinospora]|nr:hypothetical protein DFH27DRAFT_221415 [Peziza echinospora]
MASRDHRCYAHAPTTITICSLPNELLSEIFKYLSPTELARLAPTCRTIYMGTLDDTLWQSHVAHLRLTSPAPYESYHQLYLNLREHLYLAPHIWFSNQRWRGSVYVFRYNPQSGNIEGVPVIARRGLNHQNSSIQGQASSATSGTYYIDPLLQVTVATFRNPKIQCVDSDGKTKIICSGNTYYDRESGVMIDKDTGKKWMTGDGGVISLGRVLRKTEGHQDEPPPPRRPKPPFHDTTRPIGLEISHPEAEEEEDAPEDTDNMHDRTIWPPDFFPAREQINLPLAPISGEPVARNSWTNILPSRRRPPPPTTEPHPTIEWDLSNPAKLPRAYDRFEDWVPTMFEYHPQDAPATKIDERFACDTIYVYKSMSRVGPSAGFNLEGVDPQAEDTMPFRALEVLSKVHPSVYTHKTSLEPGKLDLTGIWLGDYFSAGPEILLFNHPWNDESRLEVMKLTGDCIVPRGELTFTIPILIDPAQYEEDEATGQLATPSSFLRYGQMYTDLGEFHGKPIFEGKGQLAHQGFARRHWNEVHFVVLDDGKDPKKNFGEVCVHWTALKHVSRIRKIDVHKILFPYKNRPRTVEERMTGSGGNGQGIVYSTDGNIKMKTSIRINPRRLADMASRWGV